MHLQLQKAENGFTLTKEYKLYVATSQEDLLDQIRQLLRNEWPEKPESLAEQLRKKYPKMASEYYCGGLGKIDAIKQIRLLEGLGLKEAKDVVEEWPQPPQLGDILAQALKR